MPYLIDGHNVIHALPDIELGEQHDEIKLVLKLRAWAAHVKRKVVVIFDGGIPGGPARPHSTPDVQVVFAARDYTIADRIIRERVSKLPDPANWTVVSSDGEVLETARSAGARVLSAQGFAERLNWPRGSEREKPDTVSPAEIAAWLAEFAPEQPAPTPPVEWTYTVPHTSASSPAAASSPPGKPQRPVRLSAPERPRGECSIGEQVGAPAEPEPQVRSQARPAPPAEKPEEVTAAEMDEWLSLFPEPPDRPLPAPVLPPRPARRRPLPLSVQKEAPETLSAAEVRAWLEMFGDAQAEPPPPAVTKPHPQRSTRLERHRQRALAGKPEEPTTLSEEDMALWQRMFGAEE